MSGPERLHDLDDVAREFGVDLYPFITEDRDAGAAYLSLSGDEVARTVAVTDWLAVDVDKDGRAVGVELLHLPPERRPMTRPIL